MEPVAKPIWEHRLQDPSLSRKKKPRSGGLTMVIDKGMGISAFRDLLELAADYIDFIKLGFGTTILTPAHLLKEKLRLSESFGVHLYPGGTFFEVAYIQDGMNHYFETLFRIGFQWLEISDGTFDCLRTTHRVDHSGQGLFFPGDHGNRKKTERFHHSGGRIGGNLPPRPGERSGIYHCGRQGVRKGHRDVQ